MAFGVWADGVWTESVWAAGVWEPVEGATVPTITIAQGAAISVAVGKTKQLTVTLGGVPTPSVGWASADELVVTVSGGGGITGVAEGGPINVTATATNSEGVATDVIAVTVTAAVNDTGSRTLRRFRRKHG